MTHYTSGWPEIELAWRIERSPLRVGATQEVQEERFAQAPG